MIINANFDGYTRLINCLCCDSTELKPILDLNDQPLANSYLNRYDIEEDTYPLGINYCVNCTHTQLTVAVDPDRLFRNYLYVSGTTKTLRDYFDWFVNFTSNYTKGKRVLDIACNDGTQLDSFKTKGYITSGIDPAVNLYELSSKKHEIILDYFPTAHLLNREFDIIIAQNVFAHNSYPLEFLLECKNLIDDNGAIFIQTSQSDMIKNKEFDTIYHEHLSFFSVKSFCTLAKRAGLNVIDVIRTPVHGTSFVFVLSKTKSDKSLDFILKEDELTYSDMIKYAISCNNIAKQTKSTIESLRNDGYKVIGYGAAAKGNTFQNYSKFNLDYIIDENPLKQGLFTPGLKTQIVSLDILNTEVSTSKLCIVPLAWNFFDEIKSKVQSRKENVIFLRYFPEVQIVT